MTEDTIARQLLTEGHGRFRLGPDDLTVLAKLRAATDAFFGRPPEWKAAFVGEGSGWQPYGARLAGPDYPGQVDLCERFDYWADEPGRIPGQAEIPELTSALHAWWQVAAGHTAAVLADLAAHYGYPHTMDFAGTSYLEISRYGTPAGPVPLVAPHMDGHLLTLVAADKPGLEIQVAGTMTDAWAGPGDVLVLPGQLMEMMTGAEMPGLFHRIAYRGEGGQQSVMFFVNPPLDHDIPTFTGQSAPKAEQARRNNTAFGQAIPAGMA